MALVLKLPSHNLLQIQYSGNFGYPHWFQCGSWSGYRPGVLMIKNRKNIYGWKKKYFLIKQCYLLIPRPPKVPVRPSYRRSLQPSKKNIQHFKTWNVSAFLVMWVIFTLLDPNPVEQNYFGSMRNRIRNTVFRISKFQSECLNYRKLQTYFRAFVAVAVW